MQLELEALVGLARRRKLLLVVLHPLQRRLQIALLNLQKHRWVFLSFSRCSKDCHHGRHETKTGVTSVHAVDIQCSLDPNREAV